MHLRNSRVGILARNIMLCAVVAGVSLAAPARAEAWGDRAHRRIAELAIEELPALYRGQIVLYRENLLQGAVEEDPTEKKRNNRSGAGFNTTTDIQLLMLIPHKGTDLSHYYAYRLGTLSRAVADWAFPLPRSSGSSDLALRKEFESDIDGEVESFQAYYVSPKCILDPDSPSSYMQRVSREARMTENIVRRSYATGEGYRTCKDDVVIISFRRAVEAVASVWMTILAREPASLAIPTAHRLKYYLGQMKYSSGKGYLDDLYAALQALERGKKRVPLTPTIVGEKFFELPCSARTKRIYDLAKRVDPQSSAISERKRACDEYVQNNPESGDERSGPKRRLPRSLYGRDGKPPDIFVYEHNSGLLLLTSKVKEVGKDFVLLNFEPIRKIPKMKVVWRDKARPQTEKFDLEKIIGIYARDYEVSPALVKAIIKAESDFDPYAVSSAGARGLMQLMPSTALEMEVDDIFDPIQNVGGGVQYFARMRDLFDGDVRLALAAYNAGPGNVLRHGGIPPFKETQRYVPKVLDYYDRYKNDPTPVTLSVAFDQKPAADYLPEVEQVPEIIEIIEEEIVSPAPKPSAPGKYVVVRLRNGNTMRGKAYEKTPNGVRLELERGWILIREDLITEII